MLRAPPHKQKYGGNTDTDQADEDEHQGDDFTCAGGTSLFCHGEKRLSAIDVYIIGARFIYTNVKFQGHGTVGCRHAGPGFNDLAVYF